MYSQKLKVYLETGNLLFTILINPLNKSALFYFDIFQTKIPFDSLFLMVINNFIRGNIFGGIFGYLANFWNTRVKTPHMRGHENPIEEINLEALLLEEAEEANSAEAYLILGEIYLFGNSDLGIKHNYEKGNF